MALIALACYDTEENGRSKLTKETIRALIPSVNLARHDIHVVDNGSCAETQDELEYWKARNFITLHRLEENIGTAKGINVAWKHRKKGQHCVKMDNDVIIHKKDWVDELERCISLDPSIGIIGLKRKDCWENPKHEDDFYRSTLEMLPHKAGERWTVVERVRHVMGTCQMFNSDLLDKIGYLYQPTLYGFDDCLAATRSEVAGFYNCFLPHIEIDHIDEGGGEYQDWKTKVSSEAMVEFNKITQGYRDGSINIYSEATW